MNTMQPEPHIALIVEDDPDVRELATALLEETVLDVMQVDSAEAALSCLQDRGGEGSCTPGLFRASANRPRRGLRCLAGKGC